MGTQVLLMPGINNSGPAHWQSLWQQAEPGFARIQVPDWDNPVCSEWVHAIDSAARAAGAPVVVVAHSLGCLPLAQWAASAAALDPAVTVRGLMFVALPDPQGRDFPAAARDFSPPPRQRMPFPGIVVASEDDPYGSLDYALGYAEAWGCRFENVGCAGHINAASGLAAWRAGRALLQELLDA